MHGIVGIMLSAGESIYAGSNIIKTGDFGTSSYPIDANYPGNNGYTYRRYIGN